MDSHITLRISRTWLRLALVVLVTAAVVAPVTVYASHRFTDVPDSNIFHDDIAWMADNGITYGCNPPANDEFCPKDPVTREQLSAFMHRFAEGPLGDLEARVESLEAGSCGFPVASANMEFERELFDLETGTVHPDPDLGPYPAGTDFRFAYNADRPNHIVLFQNQSEGVQIAHLDGIPFDDVDACGPTEFPFTTSLIDVPFDVDDTIVLVTGDGHRFKIGNPVEVDFTVDFDYQQYN